MTAEQVRVNISISAHIHNLGKLMARADHRNFSDEIESFIEEEARRRGFQEPVPAKKNEVAA